MNQDIPDRDIDETIDTDSATRDSKLSGEIEATLATGETPGVSSCEDLPAADQTGRYQLRDEIARGGMGVVVLGQDQELGRELAIKVMLSSGSERETARQRFIEEAQIGGQLQHPGIVPVYDVGKLDDQRPFFAMKLVKGQTLSDLLRESNRNPDDLPRFLSVFAQICQTMAYAHDKGVIHRDLKPANIMVGAFGEVQVMDWGLAKVLSESSQSTADHSSSVEGRSEENTKQFSNDSIATERDSNTQFGSVMGTVTYMPPEQAMGDVVSLGTAADVFSLGGILCQILTGQPPYVTENSSTSALHRMALHGDLDACYQRLSTSGCDPELIQLARDCLNPSLDVRLADAGKVADRITDYLQSVSQKLQAARIDQAASEAREKEALKTAEAESRRRRASIIAGALVAALLAVAGIGTFVVQRNRAQLAEERATADLETMKRETAVLRQIDGDVAWAEKMLDGFVDAPPSDRGLRNLKVAIERIKSQIESNDLDPEVTSVGTLEQAAIQVEKDSQLLSELLAFRIRKAGQRVRRSGREYFFSSDKGFVAAPQLRDNNGDVDAFERWGLTADGSSDLKNRIDTMPHWVRGEAVTALHNLASSSIKPSRYENALATSWTYPTLKSAESKRGSILTELPDHSILASGVNPNCDVYELLFETDQRVISSIRLEALTHSSFQNSGPGRGDNGYAAISDIQLSHATKDAPTEFRRLKLESCDADFSHFGIPLSPTNWNLTNGSGKSHVAFIHLAEPIKLRVGDRLRMGITGNIKRQWGYQNLGRFRVAVGNLNSSHDRAVRFAGIAKDVFQKIDSDPWTRQLWSAIDERDVGKMLELASDPLGDEQPVVYLSQLADALIEHGDAYRAAQFRDQLRWNVCLGEIVAQGKLDVDKDGIVTAQILHDSQIDTFIFKLNRGPAITAIRLDTLKDPRLPRGGPGRGPSAFNCLIRRVGLYDVPHGSLELKEIPFSDAVSDHVESALQPISFAMDERTRTVWSVVHAPEQEMCSAIFSVETPVENDFAREIRIDSGVNVGETNSTLVKARCWWTSDPVPEVAYPKRVAYDLLHRRYLRDPNNYTLLLALARLSLDRNPTDPESAISFATAALTLRPNDPVALETYVRSAIQLNPESESPWLQRIQRAAIETDKLAGQANLLSELFDYEIAKGDWAANERRWQDCVNAYRTALEINPSEFTRYRKLGSVYKSMGKMDLAKVYTKKALELDPKDEWANSTYSELLFKEGNVKDAIKHINLALDRGPTGKTHLDRLLNYVQGNEDWAAAEDVYERRFGDPKSYGAHKRLDYTILIANRLAFSEVKEQLVQIDGLEMYLQCDLALLWLLAKDRDSALASIKRAVAKGGDAPRTLLNRFAALIQRGYTPEHYRYIEPYKNKHRYTELAELLYEAMPKNDEAHRMLVYAYAASEQWADVIKVMEGKKIGLHTASSDWFTSHLALAGAYDAKGDSNRAIATLKQLSEIAARSKRKPPDQFSNRADNVPLRKPLKMYWENFR